MGTTKLRSTKLVANIAVALALASLGANAFAATVAVTSCADDKSAGTLRHAAASLASGDMLDLSGLDCADSTITLTQGEVVIAHNAIIDGPANRSLTITSDGSRIFNSTSSDELSYLRISNLNVAGGLVYTDGDSAYGGCIAATGNVSLSNSTVTDCTATNSNGPALGGAIFAQSVDLTLSRVSGSSASATGNSRSARGGGIYANSLSCTDSSLSGNYALTEAQGAYSEGGGAAIIGGDASFSRCTVDTNIASIGGGVMQFMFGGTTSISRFENSTISGNAATFASAGVDVSCHNCVPAPLQILNSTVAFNSSLYGAAVTSNGAVFATSAIIAQNSVMAEGEYADVSAAELSGSDNLIASTNVTPDAGVITVAGDPLLMPLSNNGGPTLTHALTSTSPALSGGNDVAQLSTDQRGMPRVNSGTVDIGAYQSQNATTSSNQSTKRR